MNRRETPVASSLGFYCLACTALTGFNAGLNMVFGIYLLLAIILGGVTAYQIYRSSKANNDKTVTYYFFAGDRLAFGLLMTTFYLDYQMRFINMNQGDIVRILLIIGIFFIITHFTKRFKK